MGALVEAMAARRGDRLPDRRHAGRRRRNPDLPVLCHRKEAVEAQGGVRHGRRHRGRCRSGSRQQCLGRRRAGADADARPADLGDGRDHAVGLPELRHQSGAAAADDAGRPGLGPDRQPVHRQRHPGRPQPAADRAVGAAAEDPGAAALCRHPGVRHRRHLRHLAIADRPRHPLSAGGRRLPDAALRFPDRAGHHRHDPGAARRNPVPPGDDDLEWRLVGVLHPQAVAGAADRWPSSAWPGRISGPSSSIGAGADRSMCRAMPERSGAS